MCVSSSLAHACAPSLTTPSRRGQWANLTFPGTFRIDSVRLWQKGEPRIGCDPPDHRASFPAPIYARTFPHSSWSTATAAYIARHPDIYNKYALSRARSPCGSLLTSLFRIHFAHSPNLTVFPSPFPKNRLSAETCA